MKKIIFSLLLSITATNLFAGIPADGPYRSPSDQLILRKSWTKIEYYLKEMNIPANLNPCLLAIADGEEWGHIGYHGASQGYRVYQDVIRMTIEEILQIEVREDFQFLRVPGDPKLKLNTVYDFYSYWGKKVDNKSDTRSKQLLSLNYSIFSNYDTPGSSSLYLFVHDKSKTSINYPKELAPFYREMGIPSDTLYSLFRIGHKWLDEETGVLLQIGETSHLNHPEGLAYTFADTQCYPCEKKGYAYDSKPISDHFRRIMSDRYIQRKVSVSPQLRLLLNTRYTLNPYSFLTVQRYDLYPEHIIAQYEDELRAAIRQLPFDPEKAEAFRSKLLAMWNASELEAWSR